LKKALLQIPNLDLSRMSVHALEHAKRYPWQGMVRQIANIYNNIACEHDFDTWVNNID
jgi:DNA-binding NtrC family response regulator